MKSYSNKVEGTAALKFGVDTNNHVHIIDFEYAQKSRYNTRFLCKTRTSSRRTLLQKVQNSSLASPFIKQDEQLSSLVVMDKKAVALYTTIITAFFVISTLIFA